MLDARCARLSRSCCHPRTNAAKEKQSETPRKNQHPEARSLRCGRTIVRICASVKKANCLTKNLLESDSLPQVKNLLEISFTIASFRTGEGGETVEVNDGGAESGY